MSLLRHDMSCEPVERIRQDEHGHEVGQDRAQHELQRVDLALGAGMLIAGDKLLFSRGHCRQKENLGKIVGSFEIFLMNLPAYISSLILIV